MKKRFRWWWLMAIASLVLVIIGFMVPTYDSFQGEKESAKQALRQIKGMETSYKVAQGQYLACSAFPAEIPKDFFDWPKALAGFSDLGFSAGTTRWQLEVKALDNGQRFEAYARSFINGHKFEFKVTATKEPVMTAGL